MPRESSRATPVVLGFLQRRLVHRLQLRLGLSRAESRPVETLVSPSKQAAGGSGAAAPGHKQQEPGAGARTPGSDPQAAPRPAPGRPRPQAGACALTPESRGVDSGAWTRGWRR